MKDRLRKHAIYKRERYGIRKEEQMCVTCGEPIEEFTRCLNCRVKRSRESKLYRERKKNGN